ncbi:X-Pro dipeptidyl-peptidase [Geomicrobium halophilum]|uniref:Xaa-Pro dipeptidyl-peptidase n=2 Tax=Geomicrobium halophilum TaxID=549000 RepID=A0A841PQP9_9BACL|nr:X-Pro dipeptidyl-peptidase [Geomicrobium halophilum]
MKISYVMILSVLFLCLWTGMNAFTTTELSTASASDSEIHLNGHIQETASSLTNIELEDGMTSPIYSMDDVIVENLYVETEIDSDDDGDLDLVSIEVMRPKTEPGVQVPVIFEMSPYRAGLNPINFHDVDVDLTPVDDLVTAGVPLVEEMQTNDLGRLGNYYVPRGYGVILGESIGSGRSYGCPTTGDENEILGTKAVIDWLNGNAKAFTEDGEEVSADWSTGNVGMTGASYNGTLPNGVATTGVEGLKTIIPVVAISSWYDYFRANGAVVAPGGFQGEDTDNLAEGVLTRDNPEICEDVIAELYEEQDRESGDYNDFWAERDYVKDADNIKASVLVVHGLDDWNVKTKQFAQWWEALKENDVTRKMWLHQGGHGGTSANNWQETENRWFDYWLYGIENGIMDEPIVDIEREDGSWSQEADWPAVDMEETTLHFNAANDGEGGTLSMGASSSDGTEDFIDDPMIEAGQLAVDPQWSDPNRLVYLSPALTEEVRLSGTPEVKIKASIDRPAANLTALLVDYSGSSPEIVSRGWMDPQNRHSVEQSESIVPGQDYTFEWDMQPKDHVFQPGHQIGIVIMASDHEYTIRPPAGTEITVAPGNSEVTLPIVGDIESMKISAASLQTLVDQFAEEGAFVDEEALRSLDLHLTAVGHYENQEDAAKVVQHMQGFQDLLDHQLRNERISEEAYDSLQIQVDTLMERWDETVREAS